MKYFMVSENTFLHGLCKKIWNELIRSRESFFIPKMKKIVRSYWDLRIRKTEFVLLSSICAGA